MTKNNQNDTIKSSVLVAVKLAKLSLRTGGSNHNQVIATDVLAALQAKLAVRTALLAGAETAR